MIWSMSGFRGHDTPTARPKWVFGPRWAGLNAIVLVTALWGLSNVVIRRGETEWPLTWLLLLRFLIAGLSVAPLAIKERWTSRNLSAGLYIGIVLGLSVWCQGQAMKTLPVTEVAFISALYVIWTPFPESFAHRTFPGWSLISAVFLSLIGLALLTGVPQLGESATGLGYALLGSIGLTVQIVGTTKMAKTFKPMAVTGIQSLGASVGLAGLLIGQIFTGAGSLVPPTLSASAMFAILYMALPGMAWAGWLQAWGQSRISSTEAALAFNLEPVWTTAFSWLFLGQLLTITEWLGTFLMALSIALVLIRPPQK